VSQINHFLGMAEIGAIGMAADSTLDTVVRRPDDYSGTWRGSPRAAARVDDSLVS
jgi:hypothetical protein